MVAGFGLGGLFDGLLPGCREAAPARILGEHQFPVHCLAFAPDGKTLASGGGFPGYDGEVRLWDVAMGTVRAILRGHRKSVYSTTFAKDGRTLATASYDGVVKLWDVASAQEFRSVPIDLKSTGLPIAFSSVGGVLAFAGSAPGMAIPGCAPGEVQLWHIPRQAEHGLGSGSGPLAIGDERRLVLWHIVLAQDSAIHHAKFPHVAAAGEIGNWPTVEICELPLRQERFILRNHEGYVSSLVFSPEGERLASASFDKTARLWDVATGKERAVLRGHTAKVNGVAFAPNGNRLASASRDRSVRLWDTATGLEEATYQGHIGAVTCVAFAPYGQWLASGSYDKTVRLWPVAMYR
jgi:WD40 repeat protein